MFTKADGDAIGYTKMYMLPDVPRNIRSHFGWQFLYQWPHNFRGYKSGWFHADFNFQYSPSPFRNFQSTNFFEGQHTQINISGTLDTKRSCYFWSNNEIYLTDEDNGSGNHLYYIDLSAWIPTTTGISENSLSESITAAPNPSNNSLQWIWIRFNPEEYNLDYLISLVKWYGKCLWMSRFLFFVWKQQICHRECISTNWLPIEESWKQPGWWFLIKKLHLIISEFFLPKNSLFGSMTDFRKSKSAVECYWNFTFGP